MSPIQTKAFISLIFILKIVNSTLFTEVYSPNTVRLEKDDKHNIYVLTKDGQITEEKTHLDPDSFDSQITCYSNVSKMTVFFEIKYVYPTSNMLVYSSADSAFPGTGTRTIKKNDLFIPETKDLVVYSKMFKYDNNLKLCKQLNSIFATGASHILELLRTSDLQFFRDVYRDLQDNHFELFASMYKYPFDDLTPKHLAELNRAFNHSLKEWAASTQIIKGDFEMGPYANPVEHQALQKAKQVINKVKQFCTEREQRESTSTFLTSRVGTFLVVGLALSPGLRVQRL